MYRNGGLQSIIFAILVASVAAQVGPDPRWLSPNGSFPDFTDSYKNGDTVVFSWTAINNSRSDLWLASNNLAKYNYNASVGREYNTHAKSRVIMPNDSTENIDISVAGSISYKLNVPDSIIDQSDQFVLHFFPAGALFGILQFSQFISPGFVVTDTGSLSSSVTAITTSTARSSSAVATTSFASISSTATISSATSTTNTASASGIYNTSSDQNSNKSSGLSVGAQAGIGVGVALGVIALFALGCFFGRKYRIARRQPDHPAEKSALFESGNTKSTTTWGPVELSGSGKAPWSATKPDSSMKVEAAGDIMQPQELSADNRAAMGMYRHHP